ncbi:MAG: bifunctional histidinol-phosphatase/imidazoleglycerol-phosphate dehydratase HisB [Cyclobacteriaceae bacterium]|jgi:imidazoleglycerol-phosphate dehydratase/histidinol-phosphatase|nr:bifunctional histidinol-phosphatase/imidazoleglycerol-phosphate dehydratase HisB [Cyclobacteriaceae bacterium]
MKRALFIDRDGTIILEPADHQIDSLEKLEFYPGVIHALRSLAQSNQYELIMVTNQDGLGTTSFPEETFWPAHSKMMKTLEGEGVLFTKVHIDKSLPAENKPTRKPGTGMLQEYLQGNYDLANSYVIGDRFTDIELAKNLGAKGILISRRDQSVELHERKLTPHCSLATSSWETIVHYLLTPDRFATVHRKTKETDIQVSVVLEGTGKAAIQTGLGFFDHMLEQIARHGRIDLSVKVAGDLHIDEHHTIEDTGLALGEAILSALGDKRGIERYGFCLPMDDCLAQVALDFGGRPWLVWDAEFKREKIGEMPTEMFMHFFKSFSDASRSNLNIQATGTNEHHKIESIFKCFARALRLAIRRDGTMDLPSTKGTL